MNKKGIPVKVARMSTKSRQLPKRARWYCWMFCGLLVLTTLLLLFMQYKVEGNIPVKAPIKRNVYDHQKGTEEIEHQTSQHDKQFVQFVHKQEPRQMPRKKYRVLWYSKLSFLFKNRKARLKDFSECAYNNCQIALRKSLHNVSDAVLFDGRYIKNVPFNKSNGQIWVFAAHESQWLVDETINHIKSLKRSDLKSKFNWTMTFDKWTADIWLPYGKIKKRSVPVERDFLAISRNKTEGAIIVTSHCETKSHRMEFINKLQEHTEVTVLGKCGSEWTCGKGQGHDNCFGILNKTYAFYLAFENALCDHYFTEKLFENFKYDILLVTRGGSNGISSTYFPTGSVISTDTFPDVKHLGSYLTYLTSNKEEYARLLEEKSKYYAVDYAAVYQQALCDLCFRLNHQTQFYKVIPDITRLFRRSQSCTRPQ